MTHAQKRTVDMPVTEITIIAKPILGTSVVATFDIIKNKIETLGSVDNPLIASVLVEMIVPVKEAVDRKERRQNDRN